MNYMWLLLGGIILIYGVYTLLTWHQMKKTGQVNQRIMSRNRLLGRPCRDKQAFYEAVVSPTMVFGVITTVVGVITLITEILHAGRIAGLVADIGFLGAAIWYSKKVTDAIREYYY